MRISKSFLRDMVFISGSESDEDNFVVVDGANLDVATRRNEDEIATRAAIRIIESFIADILLLCMYVVDKKY
jgi:hypothetical protein